MNKNGVPAWKPTKQQLQRIVARHLGWIIFRAGSKNSGLRLLDRNDYLDHIVERLDWRREARSRPQQAVLCNADLSNADLHNAYLGYAILSSAYLGGANLVRAHLHGADLSGADLSGADLSRANISQANLSHAYVTQANLNHADLSGSDLSGADLRGADLKSADLSGANLRGLDFAKPNETSKLHAEATTDLTDLSFADMSGANLSGAVLNNAQLAGANLSDADLEVAKLRATYLSGSNLSGADLGGADLSGANVNGVNLNRALMVLANLRGADLGYSNLTGAKLRQANLREADLTLDNLSGADLYDVDLRGADLTQANLSSADLSYAQLTCVEKSDEQQRCADLRGTQVSKAKLAYTDLTGAIYAPVSEPPDPYVAGIRGIPTLHIPTGEIIGLVQLRKLFQDSTLRDAEREATYTLERNRTTALLASAPPFLQKQLARLGLIDGWQLRQDATQLPRDIPPKGAPPPAFPKYGGLSWIEGVLRIVGLDISTAYGLHPTRALFMIACLAAILTFVYIWPICRAPKRSGKVSGIYRIFPADPIDEASAQTTVEPPTSAYLLNLAELARYLSRLDPPKERKVIRVYARNWLSVFGIAAYFSLLSAVNIGFDEFNPGDWIRRLQAREYSLEAVGWVRIVAGAQALLSLYLLAMWVLTQFGWPFN